jgi:hypothetical protein
MKKQLKYFLFLIFLSLFSCDDLVSYPETPSIKFRAFNLYYAQDQLGNDIILGKLEIDFTDGDGDIGLDQPVDTSLPDTLKYNLFLTLHEINNGVMELVEGDKGKYFYRVPYMERIGQNKTMKGTITVDLEFTTIDYDSIVYTYFLMDRAFNRSNTDTSSVVVFTGLDP